MDGTPYRQDFPALANGDGRTPAVAHLDNAATTQKPEIVLRAIDAFYRQGCASPYRGSYRASARATALYEGARSVVAAFAGADVDEMAFTKSATEALNLAASDCARRLAPGDEVAVPWSEHHSSLVTWQETCRRTGARLVLLDVDEDGRLPAGELDRKLGPATRVVAAAHVSNVLGTVLPVEEIVARAHAAGVAVVLDCTQSVAHRPLDLHALGADYAAFSGHKMYGPLGAGVLFARRELMRDLRPLLFGGEMVDVVRERRATFADAPKRLEAGTPDTAAAVGLAAAADYLGRIGFDEVGRIERELTRRLLAGLRAIGSVEVYGDPCADADRAPLVSFNVKGLDPQDVAFALDRQGVEVRSGSQCAQPLHRRLGIEASVRASPCFYNTSEEVDRLLEAVEGARRAISRRIMAQFP